MGALSAPTVRTRDRDVSIGCSAAAKTPREKCYSRKLRWSGKVWLDQSKPDAECSSDTGTASSICKGKHGSLQGGNALNKTGACNRCSHAPAIHGRMRFKSCRCVSPVLVRSALPD